jgi:hypothetical protein
MVQSQRAWAVIDIIPPSTVPPPPGKLVLDFTTIPPPAFDREHLHFIGRPPASTPDAITFRFFWELPSGDLAYSIPITYGLANDDWNKYPMDAATTVGGCPTHVGLEFTTTRQVGVTFSGTFDHQCTIPEPGNFAVLALMGGCAALMTRRRRGDFPRC